jgi:GNAT superfamily N-acetyltransferase
MIRVVPIELDDEETFRTWHQVFVQAMTPGRIDPYIPTYSDMRHLFTPSSSTKTDVWLAYYDDQPAGIGGIQLPLLENVGLAYFAIGVVPELRCRGVGAALYDYTVERVKAEGRHSMVFQLEVAPENLDSAPGVAFATKRGLTARNTMIRRRLPLPVPPATLDAFEAKAAERCSRYQLLQWAGACPDEHAEQYAALKGLLSVEAPQGDLEMEEQKWDVARLRESEERSMRSGETTYTTVAVAPDGTLAGHTQIGVERDPQGQAFQFDTLVLGAHRGHRLGLALKVANLRALQAAHGDLDWLVTSNAEQNAAMVKVNVDMGFEIVEITQLWQGEVAA